MEPRREYLFASQRAIRMHNVQVNALGEQRGKVGLEDNAWELAPLGSSYAGTKIAHLA